MTLGQHEIKRHPLLATVFTLLQAGHYCQAGQVLASQDAYFYDQVELKVLYGLLAQFPQSLMAQKPEFFYLQALVSQRMGKFQQATRLLISAKDAYAATQQHQGVVCCALELARLAQQHANVQTAQSYLYTEVQPRLDQWLCTEPILQAHCALQMADGCLAQGALSAAVTHAQRALVLYSDNRHGYGQVLAELWLARFALNAGNYADVCHHLHNAQQQVKSASLGIRAEARLLHVQLLLAWYQRALEEAMQTAQSYLNAADTEPYSYDRIEARLLMGNLYRDLRQYRTAASWYTETALLIEQLGYAAYTPRLQAESAWLHMLEGQLNDASTLLDEQVQRDQDEIVIDQAHWGEPVTAVASDYHLAKMKRQVVRAVLHLLDGQWTQADTLIREALALYQTHGDELAVCALRLYLAYSALHQGELSPVLRQLEPAFQWLAAHQITTFPDWWHPKILAEVCTHALLCDLCPALVEQILVQHLGKASLPALKLLEKTEDIDLRRRVYRLRQMIRGDSVSALDQVRDSPNKQVIQELLGQGELCAETYHELESELMTAHHRPYPNPTIIAVFGLYIKGYTRAKIAETLSCSLENVRNYITIIYQHFGLPLQHFQNRTARKQKLIEVARARGFIY